MKITEDFVRTLYYKLLYYYTPFVFKIETLGQHEFLCETSKVL